MKIRLCVLAVTAPLSSLALAQSILPAGTAMQVATTRPLPLRLAQQVRAQLLYPVYFENHLVIPAHALLVGQVIALSSDSPRRNEARWNADFTPYRVPTVQFTALLLADGSSLPLTPIIATGGAPLLRLTPAPPHRGGLIRQEYQSLKQGLRQHLLFYTAPGKADRLRQAVYSQLPWHPQRLEDGASWTLVTTAPTPLPAAPDSAFLLASRPVARRALPAVLDRLTEPDAPAVLPAAQPGEPPIWLLQANLQQSLDSARTHVGDPVTALVVEPCLDATGAIAVPQGSILSGVVTQARPARYFARAGVLRFAFNQITLPASAPRSVRTTLAQTDSSSAQQLAMDSEGNVEPQPPSKIAPLLLAALAVLPLHHDADDSAAEQAGKNTVAANSIGLIGFIAGAASRQAAVGAGIGFYGTAVAAWRSYFARGRQLTFAPNTRILLRTQATRASVLHSTPQL